MCVRELIYVAIQCAHIHTCTRSSYLFYSSGELKCGRRGTGNNGWGGREGAWKSEGDHKNTRNLITQLGFRIRYRIRYRSLLC